MSAGATIPAAAEVRARCGAILLGQACVELAATMDRLDAASLRRVREAAATLVRSADQAFEARYSEPGRAA